MFNGTHELTFWPALEFSKTLKHAEEMQESLSAELSQTTEMLRTVQGNLEKNVESFKSSVNALDTRFAALKKWVVVGDKNNFFSNNHFYFLLEGFFFQDVNKK